MVNLGELRTAFLRRIFDPNRDEWDSDEQLHGLLNEAYRSIVAEVDKRYPSFFVGETPVRLTLTADTDTLEYDIKPSGPHADGAKNIRRPFDVTHVSPETERPWSYDIVNFVQRHDIRASRKLRTVYFKRTALGVWRVGFIKAPSEATLVDVQWIPTVTAMVTDEDEPVMLPFDHHDIVSTYAVVLGKGEESKRSQADVASVYVAQLGRLMAELSGIANMTVVRRF